MSQYDLEFVNRLRSRFGRRPLTDEQAKNALEERAANRPPPDPRAQTSHTNTRYGPTTYDDVHMHLVGLIITPSMKDFDAILSEETSEPKFRFEDFEEQNEPPL